MWPRCNSSWYNLPYSLFFLKLVMLDLLALTEDGYGKYCKKKNSFVLKFIMFENICINYI